jgi:hypothetical protein
VGILGTALLLGSNVGGKHVGGSKKCSVQLVDPDGETIDDPNGVSLILPAGQEIDVTVQGNTLHFECPKVAVNARVRLARADRYEKSGAGMTAPDPMPAADDQKDDADMKAVEGVELDGDILISPEPGIQRIRLESSAPKARYPEFDYQPASVTKEEEKADDQPGKTRRKKKPGVG